MEWWRLRRHIIGQRLQLSADALGVLRTIVLTLDVLREPQDSDYRALLEFLVQRAGSFSLVWRSDGRYEQTAEVVRHRLAPLLIRTEGTSEWPGTQSLGGLATVRHYRADEEAIPILVEPGHLYAWQAPQRPEDLAFYGARGEVLFGSIAHESASWFEGLPELEVRAALPSLLLEARESSESRPDA